MTRCPLVSLVAAGLLAIGSPVSAADAKGRLDGLVEQLRTQVREGKLTENGVEELKKFDSLAAEYKSSQPEEAAAVVLAKALFIGEVLGKEEAAMDLLKQVESEYQQTEAAKKAQKALAIFAEQVESARIERSLRLGARFPDFNERALSGKPLSLTRLRGKVILVDFWATSCDSCLEELPSLADVYLKHRESGFEIVGISLDRDQTNLAKFIREKGVSWPQYCDGKEWEGKLVLKYGVSRIPTTYLLDKRGRIIGKNMNEEELKVAIANALAEE